MKNSVRISALLAFHILCYSMIELKDNGFFGSMSFVITYAAFNLFFAVGIFLHGFFRPRFAMIFSKSALFLPLCLVYWLSGVIALLSADMTAYMVSIFFSAIISGVIGGFVYYSIYADIPKWNRGRVIGSGMLFGTLIHYFIELLRNHSSLHFIYVFTAVFFIAITGIYLLLSGNLRNSPTNVDENSEPAVIRGNFKALLMILIASTAVICYLSSIYEGIIAMVSIGEQSTYEILLLRNTKLLYCASLAVAGLIADLKGRQYISMITIAVMTFLIFNIFFLNYSAVKFLNWIILFVGAGFLAMFVTLNFIDIAGQTKNPALWAGGGRIIKHSVTALGSVAGAMLWNNTDSGYVIIVLQYLILLIALIFLLFQHYRIVTENAHSVGTSELYGNEECESQIQASIKPFEVTNNNFIPEFSKYGLTERERQILNFIFAGTQTKDIAKELYITERTVKFHITNIFKKTGYKNQRELISNFANHYLFKQ